MLNCVCNYVCMHHFGRSYRYLTEVVELYCHRLFLTHFSSYSYSYMAEFDKTSLRFQWVPLTIRINIIAMVNQL